MSIVHAPLPFSEELSNFIRADRAFSLSLKLANPARFEVLHTLIVSRLPDGHALADHQVLGITYLDKDNLRAGKRPLFKQDFVVRQPDGSFVSYTATNQVVSAASPSVQSMNEFERRFGDGGRYYTRLGHHKPLVHHLDDVDELPPEQHDEAEELKKKFSSPPVSV